MPSTTRPINLSGPWLRVRQTLKPIKWAAYRKLGLSPMRRVIRDLKRRDVPLRELSALELFGGTGDDSDYVGVSHMRDYAHEVASLEIWEIDPDRAAKLRENFPFATVRNTDSHEELLRTSSRYGLIVVDNPESTYSDYCEHFDLFPGLLRVASDSAVLILNVIPELIDTHQDAQDDLFDERHLERRRSFYRTSHPEAVPVDQMVEVYRDLVVDSGFELEWHFSLKRTIDLPKRLGSTLRVPIHYLVLKIRRTPS